jgi:hypothetical protein
MDTTMATTSTRTMPEKPVWATALFRLTRRLPDSLVGIVLWKGIKDPKRIEIELLPGVTMEQVLAEVDISWDQCFRFFNGKFVWMAPTVFISNAILPNTFNALKVLSIGLERDPLGIIAPLLAVIAPGILAAIATNNNTFCVYTTEGTNPRDPAVMSTCDFLVRLLSTVGPVQQQHHRHPDDKGFVLRSHQSDEVPPPISCAALSRLLQDANSNIRKLKLSSMVLNEDHIRALATVSGSMEIILDECRLEDDTECRNAFVQCLVRNRGPTQLYRCRIDNPILTAALTGNSRVSTLKLERNAHKGALFRALAHNRGLVKLDLSTNQMSNAHWRTMCQSLQMHPALTDMDLRMTGPLVRASFNRVRLSNEQKAYRTGLLADVVKTSTVLHTIRLDNDERDNQIYVDTILPHLETNLYRLRVHAIKKAESQIRRPLLGRALQTKSVRQKPNLLWMFLSGNPDISFMISIDEESEQASTHKPKENNLVHFPGDKGTYSTRTANATAVKSNSSQSSQSSSPTSADHQIDGKASASENKSRDEIDRMLKRLEANEATISQQDATIKELQMTTSQQLNTLAETATKAQESIDQLTAQLSVLGACFNNDPKVLTGVIHSTTSTSEAKRGPEATP